MSLVMISPHRSRPGRSKWPGFLRKNVTVSTAGEACPRTFSGIPHQRRWDIHSDHGDAAVLRLFCSTAATNPETSRVRPAPNTASMIKSAPSREAPANVSIGPSQRSAFCFASPFEWPASVDAKNPNRPMERFEVAGNNEPISAIISWPDQN